MADWNERRLHFVGIGGAGMSGLALVARTLGAEVSGSDRSESSYTERLRRAGIEPTVGHDAANVPDAAEVVVSTAIAPDNPELVRAREAGLRVVHRGELLAEVAAERRSIAVAGAHGKTTTAAMVAHVLTAAGRDPAYLIGGEVRSTGSNAGWGDGDWIVVEADESDRSFLHLRPDVAVVTNIELDHHSTYRSELELRRAFEEFVAPAGTVIAWEGAPLGGATTTYGIAGGPAAGEPPALAATGVDLGALGSAFTVAGERVELGVPGEHNVLNALAAVAAAGVAGVDAGEAAAALASFQGTGRRFEAVGSAGGALVYDDYAHHPTEIEATLTAARRAAEGRLVACFQPHLYSRTRHLAPALGRALALADLVVVVDVYPARERAGDFPGVSGHMVARAAAAAAGGREVRWIPEMDAAADALAADLRPGDLVVTIGAGDVRRVAERLVAGAPEAVA